MHDLISPEHALEKLISMAQAFFIGILEVVQNPTLLPGLQIPVFSLKTTVFHLSLAAKDLWSCLAFYPHSFEETPLGRGFVFFFFFFFFVFFFFFLFFVVVVGGVTAMRL